LNLSILLVEEVTIVTEYPLSVFLHDDLLWHRILGILLNHIVDRRLAINIGIFSRDQLMLCQNTAFVERHLLKMMRFNETCLKWALFVLYNTSSATLRNGPCIDCLSGFTCLMRVIWCLMMRRQKFVLGLLHNNVIFVHLLGAQMLLELLLEGAI
jgi:hypothetical protein